MRGRPMVRDLPADEKIVTLRADWTNQDPRSAAELAKYKRAAVPFNVVWLPGKPARDPARDPHAGHRARCGEAGR